MPCNKSLRGFFAHPIKLEHLINLGENVSLKKKKWGDTEEKPRVGCGEWGKGIMEKGRKREADLGHMPSCAHTHVCMHTECFLSFSYTHKVNKESWMLPTEYSQGWMTKYTLECCQWESFPVALPLSYYCWCYSLRCTAGVQIEFELLQCLWTQYICLN